MPAMTPSSHPRRHLTMDQAARQHMVITLKCAGCRREVHYWAADLVTVLGPYHQTHVPPWPCGRCRSLEYVSVRWSVPDTSTLANLVVRRPVKQITKWIWRDAKA
jgi:hypothetical protein